MSATIIAFPGAASLKPQAVTPAPFTEDWQARHLPLIDAAMDMLRADDAEFRRRCSLIAAEEGPGMLRQLAAQIDRLGMHVGDVVDALTMTAMRIRTTMATS